MIQSIKDDYIALAVYEAVEAIPEPDRLNPTLYSLVVAQRVREAVEAHQLPINRTCPTCDRSPGHGCVRITDGIEMKGFHAMRFPPYQTADITRILE